jgi:hypothetical protein
VHLLLIIVHVLTYSLPDKKAKQIATSRDEYDKCWDDNDNNGLGDNDNDDNGRWVDIADDEDKANGGRGDDDDGYKEINDDYLYEPRHPAQLAAIFEHEVSICSLAMSRA